MKVSKRKSALILFLFSAVFLFAVTTAGMVLEPAAGLTDFTRKNLPPSLQYPFGTDWMGRDVFIRTLSGLSMSIRLGLLTAAVSAVIAFFLGSAAASLGRWADSLIVWFIDLIMGIPHILLLLLISFAFGRGFTGVAVGIAFTHWTSLARVIRGEVIQLRESVFIQAAHKLGTSRIQIIWRHMAPHLFPQFLVGLILLFPHAILHEASITFLGFGLPPEQPAIGIILSESMRYLAMGKWWLAVLPGILLVVTVILFDLMGESLRKLTDPASIHE